MRAATEPGRETEARRVRRGESRRGGAASPAGRRLVSYLWPYRRRLLAGVGLLLVTNALDKLIPWLFQHAVDALTATDFDSVKRYGAIAGGVAALMWIVRALSRIRIFHVGRDVELDLRNELLDRVHRLGPSFFGRVPTGELMSRATNDLGQIRLLIGFGMLNVVNTVFAYVGAIGLMLVISPKLTVLAMLPYPFLILIAQGFGRKLYRRSREAQEALGTLADRAQETISGMRVVRSFGVEAHAAARFEEANQRALERNMRLVVLRGLMWPLLMTVGSVGVLIVVWQGGAMILAGELTAGQFAAFNAYLGQLVWPTIAFGYLLSVFQRGRASYARVREVLDAEPEVVEVPQPVPLGTEGSLRVADLSLDRDGRRVLDGVSLEVPAGGSLAIVGPVGAGKSTLAAALPRLLPTPHGAVFVDGTDVTEAELRHLRRTVGYAQQEPFLFSTTVERNIAFGLVDPDAPDALERIRRAAEDVAILDEIDALPHGFETLVGERGVQLSGGQKQRVALARAILNEPSVLILDDPMSAVDARTEARILGALDRTGEGRTLVLVTNRVVAASRAERIAVIEQGRVTETGTHDELLASGGFYARLAARQRLERELEALS